MRLSFAIGAATLLAFTTACENTADGVRQDAAIAAEKTEQAAEQTGTAVGAAAKTAEVKAALIADSRVDADFIDVDTDGDRKTVTLKGTVRTEEEKAVAAVIAAEKAGADYTIVNSLGINPTPTRP
jgi:osmotically-inducible protein OsmY